MNDEACCLYCDSPMTPQLDPLDLGWAGDGPRADLPDDGFAGILAEVFACSGCGRVAIRPVRIERASRAA
jgi:hypothetical protein